MARSMLSGCDGSSTEGDCGSPASSADSATVSVERSDFPKYVCAAALMP